MTELAPNSPVPALTARKSGWNVVGVCAALLLAHFLVSLAAVGGKSVTYDEPLIAVGGHMVRHFGDYRVDVEDGALCKWWSAAFQSKSGLKIDLNDPFLTGDPSVAGLPGIYAEQQQQWPFAVKVLFHTRDESGQVVQGQDYVNRSRAMFAFASVIAGAFLAWLGYTLCGGVGAVIATMLYAFDPNFLGHGPLLKNDVPMAIFMLAMVTALLFIGRRATIWNMLGLSLALAGAVNVKFSGIALIAMSAILLTIRALLSAPWKVLRWELHSRWMRLSAVVLILAVCGVIVYASIWTLYGFKYSPDGKGTFNLQQFVDKAKVNQIRVVKVREFEARDREARVLEARVRNSPGNTDLAVSAAAKRAEANKILEASNILPPMEEIRALPTPSGIRLLLWVDEHRLLPHAWTSGLLYTYATTLLRSGFLAGEFSVIGWWYFFPLAMLFKTPLSTLLAMLTAIIGWALMRLVFRRRATPAGLDLWPILCVGLPLAIYLLSALTTNLNIGHRHVLPVYPLIFVAIAVGLTRLMQWRPAFGGVGLLSLAVGLALEAGITYPNFITFFNAPSGGYLGGIRLLSDSSLDWGQDLPLLSKWQNEPDRPELDRLNRNMPLFLCYFGLADPAYYNITCQHLPGSWPFAQAVLPPQTQQAVIAISATNLQGTYLSGELRQFYRQFLNVQPKAVLGGTIYLYDWPVKQQ